MRLYAERIVNGRNVLKDADLADVREWLTAYELRTVTVEWLQHVEKLATEAHHINHELSSRLTGPLR